MKRSEEEVHDLESVEAAIKALSPPDLCRLRAAAKLRLRVLGPYLTDRDEEDLLQEAVTRTVCGDRHWRRGIDFHRHLDMVMKSICNSWVKQRVRAGAAAEVAEVHLLDPDPEIQSESPLDEATSLQPNPEEALTAKQELGELTSHFRDDTVVCEIIAGWAQGLSGPEIQELAGISKKEFEAGVRRLRYHVLSRPRGTHRVH